MRLKCQKMARAVEIDKIISLFMLVRRSKEKINFLSTSWRSFSFARKTFNSNRFEAKTWKTFECALAERLPVNMHTGRIMDWREHRRRRKKKKLKVEKHNSQSAYHSEILETCTKQYAFRIENHRGDECFIPNFNIARGEMKDSNTIQINMFTIQCVSPKLLSSLCSLTIVCQ